MGRRDLVCLQTPLLAGLMMARTHNKSVVAGRHNWARVEPDKPHMFSASCSCVCHAKRLRRRLPALFACLALSPLLATSRTAHAQDYPARPLRLIVPLPAGGGADIVARTISQRLVDGLRQQVIVDNRGGGGTLIGAELAARATPDGYTLFLGTATTHGINSSLYPKLPYDPVKDFTPISLVATLPLVLVTHPAIGASSVGELVSLAKTSAMPLLFASTGNGSSIQLAGELLRIRSGTRMVHVPYKGAAGAVTALLAREVQWMFSTVPPVIEHVRSQRMRALAVATTKRSPLMPTVPTITESGIAGVEVYSWNGILAPSGTPPPVLSRLHAELTRVMKLAELRERFATLGAEPAQTSAQEFARFIAEEISKYAAIVRESGAKVD